MENGAKSDRLAARAHFPIIDQPAARPPTFCARSAPRPLKKAERSCDLRSREGGREMETEKESTESSCLLLPDAPKGAGSELLFLLVGGSQARSVRQRLTNYVAACLSTTVHFPAYGWHHKRRGEIEKVGSENMVVLQSQCVEIEQGGKMKVGQRNDPKNQL